jgi:hypothetical protein
MLTFWFLVQQVISSKSSEQKQVLMGRPPFPKGVRRSERIVTFLTPAERAELYLQAEVCCGLIVLTNTGSGSD